MFCIITLQNSALMRFPHLLFFLECVLNCSHASLLEEVYDNYTSFKQFYNSYIVCLIFDLSSSLDLSNSNQISTNFQVPGSWRSFPCSLLIEFYPSSCWRNSHMKGWEEDLMIPSQSRYGGIRARKTGPQNLTVPQNCVNIVIYKS